MGSDLAAISYQCALFSATGILFMSWVGVMIMKQSFYVGGIHDVEKAKQSAFGAAGMFFFTFTVSMMYMIRSDAQSQRVPSSPPPARSARYSDNGGGASITTTDTSNPRSTAMTRASALSMSNLNRRRRPTPSTTTTTMESSASGLGSGDHHDLLLDVTHDDRPTTLVARSIKQARNQLLEVTTTTASRIRRLGSGGDDGRSRRPPYGQVSIQDAESETEENEQEGFFT